jgi:competence protein ComEC
MHKNFYKYSKFQIILALASMLLVLVCIHEVNILKGSGQLKVVMLDIGQGDAILIETPTGKQIVVDGGPNKSLIDRLSKHVSYFDSSIDMIIVTNPDKDHFAGFIPLLDKYRVGALVDSGSVSDSEVYRNFLKSIEKEKEAGNGNLKYFKVFSKDTIQLEQDIYLEILFPDQDISGMSSNDASLIFKLVYRDTSMLFTGDTTEKIEKYLVEKLGQQEDIEKLDSDILKIAHHGSRTSNSDIFLNAITPDIALISAGKNNSYGHPTPEVLERLGKRNIIIYTTPEYGDITVLSDGSTWRYK